MLAEWLGFEWYSLDETFWKGIYRLKPRHQARIDRSGIVQRSSWEPDIHGTVPCRSDAEFIEYYRWMLRDLVRRQSRSHRPIAFEVSGGLDSSAVYALACDLFIRGELLAPGMEGYTLAFPPGTPAYEVEYARAVGRHCGTTICECSPAYRSFDWYRQEAAARCDFPGVPNGVMLFGMYEAAKANGAVVVVGGYGGDEWTGQWDHGMYYADFLSTCDWYGVRRAFFADLHEAGVLRACFLALRHGIVPLMPDGLKKAVRKVMSGASASANWLSPQMKAALSRRRTIDSGTLTQSVRHSQRRFYRWLNNATIANMADLAEYHLAKHGMEMRSPFVTKAFVQFVFSTNDWMRCRGKRQRWLHRMAMGSLLPSHILDRPTKADFMVTLQTNNEEVRQSILDTLEVSRHDWLNVKKFDVLARASVTSEKAGLETWLLWNVACCDAVANAQAAEKQRTLPG